MKPSHLPTLILPLILLPTSITPSPILSPPFADPAFQTTWERTDKPIADGTLSRSFYWGPAPIFTATEDYAEGVGGKRLVQYFDKSRMEINNPTADPTSPFYVTNGLLTVELITGQLQTGNNRYTTLTPADIPLASDTDDPIAPTYATFSHLLAPSPDHTGTAQVQLIDRDANITTPRGILPTAQQTIAYYEPATHHNIPAVFWDFLNTSGPIYQSGNLVTARLSDPWFYTSGLPISEPYWAYVKIANQPDTIVYIQAFERRVLTYVPSLPEAYQVQMGNIGQHYYNWRYKTTNPTPSPTSTSQSGSLTITGAVKTPLTLDLDSLATRPAQNITANFTNPTETRTYRGPLLLDLLHEAGGEGNAGRDLLTRLIVATNSSNKKVALSWAELDPIFANRQVIIAYSQDVRTPSPDLPRLVIPSDKSGTRSLTTLTNIEVRTIPTSTTSGTTLHITGLLNHDLNLTAADLASRNPIEITVTYMSGGTTNTSRYKGVPLLQLLNEAGISPPGPNGNLTRYVQATGNTDNRSALISWGELDPTLSNVNILVAYEQDGIPITGGLTRLVVPSDSRGGRYVPYLTLLELKDAAPN